MAAARPEPITEEHCRFKDHPLYVLERHLRRNEVFIEGCKDVGTVATGPRAPTERVHLRRGRAGRAGVGGEAVSYGEGGPLQRDPRKVAAAAQGRRRRADDEERGVDGQTGEAGTPLFLADQTGPLPEHPPVVDGVVPKNKFGNLDVYVPRHGAPGRRARRRRAGAPRGMDTRGRLRRRR